MSKSGEHSLTVLQFDGADRVSNRDAVGYYFRTTNREGDVIRLAVLFSGTVLAVKPEAFGLAPVLDREMGLQSFSLAAIGDHLDTVGMLEPTPPSTSAHWIECFSPHFQDWADRKPAHDDLVERYVAAHLVESWRRDIAAWEFGPSDSLRLGRSLRSIDRILDLGDGESWSVVTRNDDHAEIKPTKRLIRAWQGGNSLSTLSAPPPQGQEDEPVSSAETPASFVYVDDVRVADLRRLETPAVDLRKVIALCEELNLCYRSQCYHAVAALTRTLIDHVPPIFGFRTFAEVANNYAAGKSLKASLRRLDGAARGIADTHLHQSIRRTESLPTRTQVNFSHDVDMLLAELIRLLEDGSDQP